MGRGDLSQKLNELWCVLRNHIWSDHCFITTGVNANQSTELHYIICRRCGMANPNSVKCEILEDANP